MTNEELVAEIKKGQADLYEQLWLQNTGFINQKAVSFFYRWQNRCISTGVTLEDLVQCTYFGLLEAVPKYEPEREVLFLTYFSYYLKTSFSKIIKIYAPGWQKDTTLSAVNLDAPSTSDAELTVLSLVPDESAQASYDEVLDRVYNAQLRADLDKAIRALPDRLARIITEQYFNNVQPAKTAEALAISRGRLNNLRDSALRKLKKSAEINKYREEFISSKGYSRGLGAWKRSGLSPQEFVVLTLEAKGLL